MNERVDNVIKEWKQFLQAGHSSNFNEMSVLQYPLLTFEGQESLDIIKALFDRGYDCSGLVFINIAVTGQSPLSAACALNMRYHGCDRNTQRKLIRLLIDNGAVFRNDEQYMPYAREYAEEKRLKDNKKKDQLMSLAFALKPLLPKDLIKQILDEEGFANH